MSTSTNSDFFGDAESNPLLKGLPPTRSRAEWGNYLRYDPRTEWGRRLDISQVFMAINQIKRIFVPTPTQVQVAWRLYTMLHQGLIDRDPRRQVNRQMIYEFGKCNGMTLGELPWFPTTAAGMMIKGITRQGKSHVVQRVLDTLPKMILRGPDEASGWLEMKQLVHLTVPMPADASRKGFLLSAFLEIDRTLGTNYAKTHTAPKASVEVQLVSLLNVLAVHRCGILIIEEAQTENIGTSTIGREFILFFLRVLNFGIPVAIIGNPKAFEAIEKHTQDLSRLSEMGAFCIDPVSHWLSSVWTKDLMPAIWGWTLGEPDEDIEGIDEIVWTYTGGFPGYLARLRRETLLQCELEGGGRIQRRHIDAAYNSPAMKPLHEIIRAFVTKDASLLNALKDMPVEYFKAKWQAEAEVAELARKRLEKSKARADAESAQAGDDPRSNGEEAEEPPNAEQSAPPVGGPVEKVKKVRAARRKANPPIDDPEDLRSDAAQARLAALTASVEA